MHAPRRRRTRAVAVAAVLAALSACGGEEAATSTTTTTAVGAFAPSGGCPMIPPGQVMSAAEATIRFSVDRVCPGYVTIPVGTTIEVRNEATKSARFVVKEGPDGSGATVFDLELDAGEATSVTFDKAGFHLYTTSLLPSFKGNIEVRDS